MPQEQNSHTTHTLTRYGSEVQFPHRAPAPKLNRGQMRLHEEFVADENDDDGGGGLEVGHEFIHNFLGEESNGCRIRLS